MKKLHFSICFLLIMFIYPISIYANVIWPSLYIAKSFRIWWIILVGLIIEFIIIRIFIKEHYLKTLLMVILMNTISTLIGIFAIPVSGIIVEIILIPIDKVFSFGTFHITHWILDFILAVTCNTLLESLTLKIVFKKILKETILWVFIANILSVILCILNVLKIV